MRNRPIKDPCTVSVDPYIYKPELLANIGKVDRMYKTLQSIFLENSINTNIHTRMSTYLYKHMHTHPIPMSTSKRLS
jgi:hypothetical protein